MSSRVIVRWLIAMPCSFSSQAVCRVICHDPFAQWQSWQPSRAWTAARGTWGKKIGWVYRSCMHDAQRLGRVGGGVRGGRGAILWGLGGGGRVVCVNVCVCVCVCGERERERKRERERENSNSNSNSKTLFSKDCSLGSFRPV